MATDAEIARDYFGGAKIEPVVEVIARGEVASFARELFEAFVELEDSRPNGRPSSAITEATSRWSRKDRRSPPNPGDTDRNPTPTVPWRFGQTFGQAGARPYEITLEPCGCKVARSPKEWTLAERCRMHDELEARRVALEDEAEALRHAVRKPSDAAGAVIGNLREQNDRLADSLAAENARAGKALERVEFLEAQAKRDTAHAAELLEAIKLAEAERDEARGKLAAAGRALADAVTVPA